MVSLPPSLPPSSSSPPLLCPHSGNPMYSGSGVVECQLWPSLLHLPHSPCCPAPHQCTHGSKEIPHKDTHCLPWMVGTLVGPTCSGPNLVPVFFQFLSLPMQFNASQYSFFSSLPYTHSSLTCILPHTLFLPSSLTPSPSPATFSPPWLHFSHLQSMRLDNYPYTTNELLSGLR